MEEHDFFQGVHKSADGRARMRRKNNIRRSNSNSAVKVKRFNNRFTPISNGMGDDIPTSGEGWTLNSA